MSKPKTLIPHAQFATTKANLRIAQERQKKLQQQRERLEQKKRQEKLAEEAQQTTLSGRNPYFDPSLAVGVKERVPRKLKFNQKGKFIAKANEMRQQQHLENLKRKIEETAKRAGLKGELDLVSNAAIRVSGWRGVV